MKHRVICLVALTGFLFLTAAAQAQLASTPYTYFEGSFQGSKFSPAGQPDVDGNGARFEVSVAIQENIYVFGTFDHTSLDDLVDNSSTPPRSGHSMISIHWAPASASIRHYRPAV